MAERNPDLRAAIIKARRDHPDMSAGDLGRLLGVTRNTVIGQLKRAGVALNATAVTPRPWSERRQGDSGGCRYILDNGQGIRDPNWRYCCAPVLPGTSWCAEHRSRVFRAPTQAERGLA